MKRLWAWVKGLFAQPVPAASAPVVTLQTVEVDTACKLKPILRSILTEA